MSRHKAGVVSHASEEMAKPTPLTPELVPLLLDWSHAAQRDLPWRADCDPYHILVSEIMLQQTRAETVIPYYHRFLAALPTLSDLAAADDETLHKLWEGLGYYSRARNLGKAAREICEKHGGRLPDDYEALLRLPGIGDYTAGAIASIAFDCRVPAIDGNVLRVLSRVTGSYDDIADPATKKRFREELSEVIPADAGDFTQALIELGATVCVPNGEARCGVCPLSSVCEAAKGNLTDSLPVKRAKKARRVEKKTVLLIRDGSSTVLSKRPPKGLLSGLYELPNVEGHLDTEAVTAYLRTLGLDPVHVERIEDAKHIFTHIEWHMIAYSVRISSDFDGFEGANGTMLVSNERLHAEYAIPSAFSAYTKYL